MLLRSVDAQTALGLIGVVLALMGGCGLLGSPGSDAPPGSLSGRVTVEDADLSPLSPLGWTVRVGGDSGYQAAVASDGAYVVAGVPAGRYNVVLQPPGNATALSAGASADRGALKSAATGDDVIYACVPSGCVYRDVLVVAGTSTLQVDFHAGIMPGPPF